jgi:hypothetical protein
MSPLVPYVGYAPDLDSTTPGVFTNCASIEPTVKGFRGARSPVSVGLPALAAQCFGSVAVRKTDDTTRLFAGSTSKLYEGASSSWTDRSGTAYSLGTSNRWRFAQFGDTSLAVAKTEKLQFLTTASTFAAATSTAPKASIVETVNNFVFLFDVNDQGGIYDSSDRPDGWWCGQKGSDGTSDWTPSVTTEAATNNLRSTAGKITAGRKFGYQIVVYKLRSMYVGTYVGAGAGGAIWDFQLIPGEGAGALSQEVVVNVGTEDDPKQIIMGPDNFYSFAGGRPVPIGNPIKDTVFAELNTQYYYACTAAHDPRAKTVRFYYPVGSSNMPEKCVVYNYLTGKWGRDDRSIEAAVEYVSGGITYDSLGSSYSTYADFPDQPYDIAFIAQGAAVPAIFDATHTLKTLSGASASSSITLGDYGDPQIFSTLKRVIPKFLSAPTTASFVHLYRDVLSSTKTQGATVSISGGRFDVLKSSRWHSGRIDMTGDHEIAGMWADQEQDGEE